jgi:hypothetical protein
MRAAVMILLGSVLTFVAAWSAMRIFLSDVKPVAWGDVAQSSVRLEAAFLLLTVENLAAVCAAIALAAILALWARSRYAISFR